MRGWVHLRREALGILRVLDVGAQPGPGSTSNTQNGAKVGFTHSTGIDGHCATLGGLEARRHRARQRHENRDDKIAALRQSIQIRGVIKRIGCTLGTTKTGHSPLPLSPATPLRRACWPPSYVVQVHPSRSLIRPIHQPDSERTPATSQGMGGPRVTSWPETGQ